MPDVLRQQIELSLETAPPLDEYADAVGATVVARGVNYGTAFEIALKIRELSGSSSRRTRRPTCCTARSRRSSRAGR